MKKIEYRNFNIEVESKPKEGLWAADISIWMPTGSICCASSHTDTLNQNVAPLSEWAEVTDYSSAEEAERIALLLAKERVDLYLLREL